MAQRRDLWCQEKKRDWTSTMVIMDMARGGAAHSHIISKPTVLTGPGLSDFKLMILSLAVYSCIWQLAGHLLCAKC